MQAGGEGGDEQLPPASRASSCAAPCVCLALGCPAPQGVISLHTRAAAIGIDPSRWRAGWARAGRERVELRLIRSRITDWAAVQLLVTFD